MSPRLARIQLANIQSRTRDLMFAAFIALAAVVSLASIGTAVDAAQLVAPR